MYYIKFRTGLDDNGNMTYKFLIKTEDGYDFSSCYIENETLLFTMDQIKQIDERYMAFAMEVF